MSSFIINLKPSEKCCNNPNNPTTLRPILYCIETNILHSIKIFKAIPNKGVLLFQALSLKYQWYTISFCWFFYNLIHVKSYKKMNL